MVDSVHGSWTAGGSVHHGPPDGAHWKPLERGVMLAGAWPPAAPDLEISSARVRRRDGTTAKPTWRSLRLERQRDGQVTTTNWWW
jgi:hypothetical protein